MPLVLHEVKPFSKAYWRHKNSDGVIIGMQKIAYQVMGQLISCTGAPVLTALYWVDKAVLAAKYFNDRYDLHIPETVNVFSSVIP
jgi:hypothetical protein